MRLVCSRGDWPDDEDEAESWDEYREARSVRDELLLPSWRAATDSICAVSGILDRYPWLRDGAQRRVAAKIARAEQVRSQHARFASPRGLLDAAAALPSSS